MLLKKKNPWTIQFSVCRVAVQYVPYPSKGVGLAQAHPKQTIYKVYGTVCFHSTLATQPSSNPELTQPVCISKVYQIQSHLWNT